MVFYNQLKEEIVNHSEFWNYYGVDFGDILGNRRATKQFIKQYFSRGDKLYAYKKEMGDIRSIHTVNAFFIGAYLQRIIDENIAIRSNVAGNYPFSYIWYLACLAHDFGYDYENYSKAYLGLRGIDVYKYTLKNNVHKRNSMIRKRWYIDHGIDINYTYNSFGKQYLSNCGNRCYIRNICYTNGTVVEKNRYDNVLIDDYFWYRICEMDTLDHGIVGADEFFSKMIVNYVRQYRQVAISKNYSGSFNEFYSKNGLHFCTEQFKVFSHIADCIAAHNVYMANGTIEDKCRYEEFGLEALLPGNFRLVSYRDNPLLFILCVADTIEPSKRFTKYNSKELFQNISIDYDKYNNRLEIGLGEDLYNSDNGQDYVNDVYKLSNWCDISVRVFSMKG